MNESQAGPNDLLDTTDCLEAVGVFKAWKNFFFVIIILCLLLLQACFFLVDRGYISIGEQAAVAGEVTTPAEEPSQVAEPPAEMEMEAEEPAEPTEPTETVQPEEVAEPETPVEPNLATEPEETAEPNQPAEPNSTVSETGTQGGAAVQHLQRAITWPQADFFAGLSFEQLTLAIRLLNAVLILTATLYCLTLLFGLKVSMHGRLGGINHISRAFFLSLLMLVLLLPWQRIFGAVVTGAIYTPGELQEWFSARTDDIFDTVLYYLRFSGYGALIFLLLLLSQFRSLRWAKAILRRLEII
ncbi:MAG: hypothetical protein ABIF19_01380 [Planctomycetota bacterium]